MATKPKLIDRLRTQLKPKSIQFIEEYVTPSAKDAVAKEPETPAPHAQETPSKAHEATPKKAD